MEKNEYIPLHEHIYTYDEIKEFKKKLRDELYETNYWNYITSSIVDKLCDFMNWLDPDHIVLRCNTSNYSMRLIKNNRTREFEYKWTSKYE